MTIKTARPSKVFELPFTGSNLILNDMQAMISQMAIITERIDVLAKQSAANSEQLNAIVLRTAFLKGSVAASGVIIATIVSMVVWVANKFL